tara:strand:- start:21 stop:230 length:210 start_codon:yes stop_codon:yes gene_type:complete
MEQSNPDAEILSVVNSIENGQRAAAIDAINDMLFSKAADAMSAYKQIVAKTFFDEPVEELPDETDNGND